MTDPVKDVSLQQSHDLTAWQFPILQPPFIRKTVGQNANGVKGRSTNARRAAAELSSHRIRRKMLCMKCIEASSRQPRIIIFANQELVRSSKQDMLYDNSSIFQESRQPYHVS